MALSQFPLARAFPSPNFDDRPGDFVPDAIVLHATTGPASPSLNWLANPSSYVSIHYLIDRDGTIYQMVDEFQRAWHAGPSNFRGRTSWNDFSIGIELVNLNNGLDPYDAPLLEACRQLCVYLVFKYRIQPNMIVTHAQISGAITGKTDPRGFPLEAFIMSVASQIPDEVRTAAWQALGVSYNPNAALQIKAKELGLGHPVTSELRVDVKGVRWVVQGYAGGIVATEEGNWGNIRKADWL
ncbi:MAG: N-acetylmuramoyl-L-alanine amidase [Chloroflexi bacterium]|nr:N-acetylmuramoyl-L-alanine amidase [Chloroflexota bacterium]MBI3733952.1 N-acetylmuramoyl-L-alanine amidase [Chloroflexota bacterium]